MRNQCTQSKGLAILFSLFLVICLFSACSTAPSGEYVAAPAAIAKVFNRQPKKILSLKAEDPGKKYRLEVSEKDRLFGKYKNALRFRTVRMKLRKRMPRNTVMVDIIFRDDMGSAITVGPVNLLRLTPKIDSVGSLQYPEFILEEFGRFGVSFRKEHGEFGMRFAKKTKKHIRKVEERAYRLGIWNNCLDPRKWEMVLSTENLKSFAKRKGSKFSLNQNRTLAHSWFYLDEDLYKALLKHKNPNLTVDPSLGYDAIAARGEKIKVDFSRLSRVEKRIPTKLLEVGHQSKRRLLPIDPEQFFKWKHGLFVNRKSFKNYSDILKSPIKLGKFEGAGYYQTERPETFDLAWMRKLNRVRVERVTVPGSNTYMKFILTGTKTPYEITFGNIDLALVDEQKFYGISFGINAYPKTRRHNPHPDTIKFDPETIPNRIKPYLFLTDRKKQTWINNQKKGVEKVLLAWDSLDRDTLSIYLVSYERIAPIWMARVRLDDDTVDQVRLRRRLYTY